MLLHESCLSPFLSRRCFHDDCNRSGDERRPTGGSRPCRSRLKTPAPHYRSYSLVQLGIRGWRDHGGHHHITALIHLEGNIYRVRGGKPRGELQPPKIRRTSRNTQASPAGPLNCNAGGLHCIPGAIISGSSLSRRGGRHHVCTLVADCLDEIRQCPFEVCLVSCRRRRLRECRICPARLIRFPLREFFTEFLGPLIKLL